VAAIAQIALRVVAPVLVGVVVGSMLAGVSTLAVLRFGVAPSAAAAGIGAVALIAGPLLPRAALRLSGLPRPLVPADAGDLVDADDGPDLLPPDELAERTDLARGHLAGLAGGCAVIAALAVVPATAAGGWAGPALAALTVAVLALRARSFADPGTARTVAASALAAGIGLAAVLVLQAGTVAGLVVAAGLLVAAAATEMTIGRPGRVIGSPVSRRAVDLVEGLLVAAVVPLALVVMDLYGLVRGL
jgi:type VII secretion integral membrane protein EccD